MSEIELIVTSIAHQLYATGLRAIRWSPGDHTNPSARDRGAVSLEQVLWFVAAGVSVAVIAAILWGQIRDKADDPITPPVAP